MTPPNQWPCEHIVMRGDKPYFKYGFFTTNVEGFNFCPSCGAARPEQPKKLWEKFTEPVEYSPDLGETGKIYLGHEGAKKLADTAKQAFLEVIDSSQESLIATAPALRGWLRNRVKEM